MRTLLCGYGNMGKNHFRTLDEEQQISHIDIFDPYALDIPAEKQIVDLEKYLKNTPPDCAILATPTTTHKEMAQRILNHSIPTLIEKPIASTSEDGEFIKKWADCNRTAGCIGFVERYNPVILALRDKIKDSRILSISVTRVGPFPPRINDVGVLVDLSVHDVDLVRFLLHGSQVLESRIYKSQKNNEEYEDNAVITMRMEGNIIANLITNWLTPFKKRMIEIATDKAYFEANLATQELKSYSNYEKNNSYVIHSCYVPRAEPLTLQLKAFINLVKTGDKGNTASYEDGIRALEILEKHR